MRSIEQWIDDLQTGEVPAKTAAAEALAALGEVAQPAIVALVESCAVDDEALRNWCTSALEAVGPPAGHQIEAVKSLASAANVDVAFWAVTLLGRARAADAVPILTERVNDGSAPTVQQRAAWALKRIQAA